MEAGLVRSQAPVTSVLSDDELLAAITRDLRSIYSEIIKQPIPEKLAGVLKRLELRSNVSVPQPASHVAHSSSGR
jgi:hypothetical protein